MNKHAWIMALGASLGACGGAERSDTAGGSEGPGASSLEAAGSIEARATVEPIHEFSVGDTEYAMVETEEGSFLLFGQAGPSVAELPHDTLMREHGPLTMLELMLALAPETPPAEKLFDYHAVESELHGRDDASILQVEYVAPLSDKITVQDCATKAKNRLGEQGSWFGLSMSSASTFGSYAGNMGAAPNALTLCNPLPYGIKYYFGWKYYGGSDNWFNEQIMPSQYWHTIYGGVVPYELVMRQHKVRWRDVAPWDAVYLGDATGYLF